MYSLYFQPIPPCSRAGRRAREREAAQALVSQAFGPDVVLTHTPEGAPMIEGKGNVFISLTHSIDLCILAVSTDGPIGIDTETSREQLRRVAHKFLAPDEGEVTDLHALLLLWTAKEAVYKAALTPGLSLQEIIVTGHLATAHGITYHIDYPQITPERVTAVAKPVG